MSRKTKKIDGLPEFSGPFADLIIQYIHFKRAQGYAFHDPIIYRLREMDLVFRDMGVTEPIITREMYEAYTRPKPPEKATTTQKRQAAIRGFAKYLVSIGHEDTYTGADDTRVFKSDFIPYVFSKEEINGMFSVLDTECSENPGYESDCFRISMLLYYCCGMRNDEVCLKAHSKSFPAALCPGSRTAMRWIT
jgi:integrase